MRVTALMLIVVVGIAAMMPTELACETPPDTTTTTSDTERLQQAQQQLHKGNTRTAWRHIDTVLQNNPLHREALYLKGEASLVYGSRSLIGTIDTLRSLGENRSADILCLKLLHFLGDGAFASELERCEALYPESPEVRYTRWLYELEHRLSGPPKADELAAWSESITLGFAPYTAAFCQAANRSFPEGLQYLQLLHDHVDYRWGSYDSVFTAKSRLATNVHVSGTIEVEYADCGSQMGLYLVDANGRKLKLSLDSGTAGKGCTVHHDSVGNMLPGDTVMWLKGGIQYNYMDKPADVVIKAVDFMEPAITAFPVQYFQGGFSLADGCISPFALPGVAITIDPVNERGFLHDADGLAAYRDTLPQERSAIIPLVVRNGWPFMPTLINGREVLMMIESGSRDVNLNELAAEHLGVKVYDSALIWRGERYPTKMFDAVMTVGPFDYEINGGLVTDWVVGNNSYGGASAGDIGPDFLRHFAFTFDPFRYELILVKPAKPALTGRVDG
jgi:hypothetical protein